MMQDEQILPDLGRHPYYVYAPAYTQMSAGIRVLHLLCHWLNRKGQLAYIVAFQDIRPYTNPELVTPLLTQEIADFHVSSGISPLVIYPEVVSGNPLKCGSVVRYLLNRPGLLGGDASFPEAEMVWAFSRYLAKEVAKCDGILHMPVLDERVFHPGSTQIRSGSAYYASKFKNIHKQEIFGIPTDAIEITRERPDSPTPQQIAEILRRSEYFYCFENTALATEAVLCGCPAVFVPNKFLDKPIAVEELGWDGYAWGTDPQELLRAKSTVAKGHQNYRRTIEDFFVQLAQFIVSTQAFAKRTRHSPPMLLEAIFPAKRDHSIMRLIERWFD